MNITNIYLDSRR